jgi:chaperone modulatory protein CbpM
MNEVEGSAAQAVIVETQLQLSIMELSRICGADVSTLEALVHEGVLTPLDPQSSQWMFSGAALPRARKATRLLQELELNVAGAALVIDLMDEIQTLRTQLRPSHGDF